MEMESTEITETQPEYITCEKHPYKKAKKYCSAQDCKKFLCNACCLEDHSKHLDSLQSIQKYYKKELESLENFSINTNFEISKNNSCFVFKCLINVFHEAKNYCLDCKNFICVKCSAAHEKSHSIVSNESLIDSLNEKLKIIKNVFSKENFVLKILEDESTLINSIKEASFFVEDKFLLNAFALKFKFESFLNLLKQQKLTIIGKLTKIFAAKQSCLFAKKFDLTKFTSFLDSYKFEKNKNKFFANFIKNENLINSIIKDYEVTEINQLIDLNSKLKGLYDDTLKKYSETLKIFESEADCYFGKYNEKLDDYKLCFIKGFEEIANKENLAFDKTELLNALYSKGNEINFNDNDNFNLENVFTAKNNNNMLNQNQNINNKNIENKFDHTPKEMIKCITKVVFIEKENNLLEKEFKKKYLKEFQSNIAAVAAENISFLGFTEPMRNTNLNNSEKNKSEKIKNSEIQNIKVEKIKFQKPTRFTNSELSLINQENEFTISKQEKKKNFSDNKLRIVKFEEPKNTSIENELENQVMIERDLAKANKKLKKNETENSSHKSFSEGEAPNNFNDENVSKICNLKSKLSSSRRKYTNSSKSSGRSNEEEILIENEDPKESDNNNTKKNNNNELNNNEKEEIIALEINSNNNNNNENGNESLNNFNIKENNNNNNNKYTINNNKNKSEKIIIPESNFSSEILKTESALADSKRVSNASASSQKSSNNNSTIKAQFHDILSFGFNCKSCFAYNPSERKITEIENTFFKFPAFHSFLNIPPYAFISGGKDSQGKELNSFSKLMRTEAKKIEVVELQKMNLPKHHHLLVHYTLKKQIICVGGSKIKACEVYDLASDSWAMLGELNSSRECPSACVTDQNTLFVFFGFDKNVNKYISTIEKLDLNDVEINFGEKNYNFNNSNKNKFEVLNVKGNQNILKKHSAAALQTEPGKVLIFGGINSLRNTCKDVLLYDFKANTGQFFNYSLPVNASFHNCGFVDLSFEDEFESEQDVNGLRDEKGIDGKFLYNFTDDFKVIKLNIENFNMEIIE